MTRASRLIVALLLLAPAAHARPLYFENFTAMFNIQEGDRLHACGVCHERWKGTGARNPFGQAVEQQVYVGKPIRDAITAVLGGDADGDGFSNGDEITVYHTLPGYSCSNFDVAIDPPPDFQSFITPNVPTCLEPKDIRLDTTSLGYLTRIGSDQAQTVTVFNNGSQFPLTVTSYAVTAGAAAGYTVEGPPVPAVIPLGGSIVLTVRFRPSASGLQNGTLQVASDDPDEPTVDVALTAVGFVRPLAPAADRSACLADVERAAERFAKTSLDESTACWLDELRGVACDTGARDRRLARARAKLALAVGGRRDRHCVKATLTPARLGMANVCDAPCGALPLASLGDLVSCIECRQDAATDAVLAAAVGAAPPDRPANRPAAAPYRCNQALVRATDDGILRIQHGLAGCELANVTAATPAVCTDALAGTITAAGAAIDAARAACKDTTALAGCLFTAPAPDQPPDPGCLRATATDVAAGLVHVVFPPQ